MLKTPSCTVLCDGGPLHQSKTGYLKGTELHCFVWWGSIESMKDWIFKGLRAALFCVGINEGMAIQKTPSCIVLCGGGPLNH
jgi:hypothetical protein